MTNYTDNMETKAFDVDYSDESEYRKMLSEAAASFRTFDEALDAVMVKNGYIGDMKDAAEKVGFIENIFRKKNIPCHAIFINGIRSIE